MTRAMSRAQTPGASAMRMRARQRGAALFLILLLLLVGAGVVFVSRLKSADVELEAQRKTAAALAQAKQALLGRAAADPNHPGSLPCPDISNPPSGVAPLLAGSDCPAYIGRLPWKTLGLPDPRDGAGESLWYALSQSFRDYTNVINTTTPGTLSVSGDVTANGLAAIVFAPGAPLAGQVRDAAHLNDYSAYLEGYASATATNFNTTPPGAINDRFLMIAPRELMNVVTSRMARELSLQAYTVTPIATGTTVASISSKPGIWAANQWDNAVDPASSVTGSTITLKFVNCGIVYTITGPNAVARSAGSC